LCERERFPSRHPLCECPALTFTNGEEVSAANAACREASGGLTHQIVSKEELEAFMVQIRGACKPGCAHQTGFGVCYNTPRSRQS
jgi:hypothetical protein